MKVFRIIHTELQSYKIKYSGGCCFMPENLEHYTMCLCVNIYAYSIKGIKITIRYSTWKNYNGCINVKVKSFSLTIFYIKIIFYAYQYFSNLLCCIWLYLVFIVFINSQFYSSGCTQFFKIRKNIIPNFPRRSYYIGSLHFTHPFNGKSLK